MPAQIPELPVVDAKKGDSIQEEVDTKRDHDNAENEGSCMTVAFF